jgi:hypothetical protein
MTGKTFTPGPAPNTVRSADGKILTAPNGWVRFPPGDAALTRRVKAAGAVLLAGSGNKLLHHSTPNVCQPKVAALKAVGEPLVIQAQQM